MPSFRHLTHWYINWVLSCLNCGLSLLNFLQLCGLLFIKECCLCTTMVSSFSFIAFTIMCFVPGSSCRGSQWRSWIRSCTCMCGQHLLLSGFWSFSAYQEEDWRNSPQGLLFCACVRVCVCVREREREGQALFGEGLFGESYRFGPQLWQR